MSNAKTHGRVHAYIDTIRAFMKTHIIANCDELDALIMAEHGKDFTDEDLSPMCNDKGRVINEQKWRNDVDWAKAHLTANVEWNKLTKDIYMYLPRIRGSFDNVHICDRADSTILMTILARKVLSLEPKKAARQRVLAVKK